MMDSSGSGTAATVVENKEFLHSSSSHTSVSGFDTHHSTNNNNTGCDKDVWAPLAGMINSNSSSLVTWTKQISNYWDVAATARLQYALQVALLQQTQLQSSHLQSSAEVPTAATGATARIAATAQNASSAQPAATEIATEPAAATAKKAATEASATHTAATPATAPTTTGEEATAQTAALECAASATLDTAAASIAKKGVEQRQQLLLKTELQQLQEQLIPTLCALLARSSRRVFNLKAYEMAFRIYREQQKQQHGVKNRWPVEEMPNYDENFALMCESEFPALGQLLMQRMEERENLRLVSSRRHALRELLDFQIAHNNFFGALQLLKATCSGFIDTSYYLEHLSRGALCSFLLGVSTATEKDISDSQQQWTTYYKEAISKSLILSPLDERSLLAVVPGAAVAAAAAAAGDARTNLTAAAAAVSRAAMLRYRRASSERSDQSQQGQRPRSYQQQLQQSKNFAAPLEIHIAVSRVVKGVSCMRAGDYEAAAEAFLSVDFCCYTAAYETAHAAAKAALASPPLFSEEQTDCFPCTYTTGAEDAAVHATSVSAAEFDLVQVRKAKHQTRKRRGGAAAALEERRKLAEGLLHAATSSEGEALFVLTAENSILGACTPADLALYTMLSSLACMSSQRLKAQLQESSKFRWLLETHATPQTTAAAFHFHNCEYGRAVDLVSSMQREIERDLFVGVIAAAAILTEIRLNAVAQFSQIFSSFTLQTLSTEFYNQSRTVLEEDLIRLVSSDRLKFRYDILGGTLWRRKAGRTFIDQEECPRVAADLVHACQRITLNASVAELFPTEARNNFHCPRPATPAEREATKGARQGADAAEIETAASHTSTD